MQTNERNNSKSLQEFVIFFENQLCKLYDDLQTSLQYLKQSLMRISILDFCQSSPMVSPLS